MNFYIQNYKINLKKKSKNQYFNICERKKSKKTINLSGNHFLKTTHFFRGSLIYFRTFFNGVFDVFRFQLRP